MSVTDGGNPPKTSAILAYVTIHVSRNMFTPYFNDAPYYHEISQIIFGANILEVIAQDNDPDVSKQFSQL